MRRIETWFWRIPDALNPKRTYVTRFRMSEAEALAQYPTAVKAGGFMVREVCETDAEMLANTTSGASSYGEWGAAPGVMPVRPTSATPAATPAPSDGTPQLPSP